MRTIHHLVYATILLLCSAAPALATVTAFTGSAAFDAAVSGAASYNFEGIAPSHSFNTLPHGITVGGLTFTGNGHNYLYVIDADADYGHYGASFFSAQYPGFATATLQSGVTAIGFTYGSYNFALSPFTVSLNTGDSFALATPLDAGRETGFIGFTSDVPITSVTFSDQGYILDILQFELGSATPAGLPVPEPATALLLGAGLIGLGLWRRGAKS